MAQDNATFEFHLHGEAESGFSRALDHVKVWCAQHQWQVGVAEMALGAGLIAAGLKTGAIQMGVDVVLSAASNASIFAGVTGAGLGALPGYLLGNIGLVAMGGGLCGSGSSAHGRGLAHTRFGWVRFS
jgi:hypothetical protein